MANNATGSDAAVPAVPGLREARPWVASDMADMLHAATIAVNAEIPLDQLWHAVPPFPTVSEVWLRLLEQYGL